ncbi:MAG: plasmid mobilization protein [Nostoc sp. DedQUE01]
MGRNKLPSELQRKVKTSFRMTEEEATALEWAAGRFGLSVSEFIRTKLAVVAQQILEANNNG